MGTLFSEGTEKLLDQVGWQILREMQLNSRIPFNELGRRVGLSAPAVAERVRRMEEAGIICGYRTEVSLKQVGFGVQAIIRLAVNGNCRWEGMKINTEHGLILECHRITGNDCYFIKVASPTVGDLEKLIDEFASYGQTTTSIILSSPVPGNLLFNMEE